MSELVDKVARAIRPTMWDSNEAARAAIKAVAEFLAQTPEPGEFRVSQLLLAQLEAK